MSLLAKPLKKVKRALAGAGIISPERMRPLVSMRAALTDPTLFAGAVQGPSWGVWKVMLIAAMGEELTPAERAVFKRFTGRDHEPGARIDELWGVIGRRGGKSRAASILAIYVAALCEHTGLAVGERGKVLLLAMNKVQAKVAFDYVAGLFDELPTLSEMIVSRTAELLSLSNGIDIEVRSASFRGIRGVTTVAIIADEAAFWFTESDNSVNSDSEILNAVRPSLATTGGPLIVISSPHGQSGEVYRSYRENFGPKADPRILVIQGASRDFNPSLPQIVVDRALARDPQKAQAEYLGQFRTDVTNFLMREVLDAAVVPGRVELMPKPGTEYVAFVDMAGGSGGDSMTVAVAHRMGDYAILDMTREVKPPFSPASTIVDFANDVKRYGCQYVIGDRWGGDMVGEQFRAQGLAYRPSEKTKSDLYMEILPLLNSGMVELLENERLITQFASLERRVARGGKSSVDHPEGTGPGCHDDLCNAACGALVNVSSFADRSTGLAMLTSYGMVIARDDGTREVIYDEPDLNAPQRVHPLVEEHWSGGSHPAINDQRPSWRETRTAENSAVRWSE